MKKVLNCLNSIPIFIKIIIILVIIIIGLLIFKKNNVNKIETYPSDVDLKYGLEKTYRNAQNISCDFFAKINYGNDYYKYSCNFDYKINEEDKEFITDAKTCVDCEIQDNKWICSISSKECFK